MIDWNRNTESAFVKIQGGDLDAMKNYKSALVQQLTSLIKLTQGDLTKPERQKVMCLITQDSHSRDIVHKLIVENVRKADEF